MTAAGKVPPAKVLVLGAGVAGLAAVQTAKNLGAVVRAFDVRPVTKEQVESMGATFLEVDFKEDGSGSGGYAKEMSDDFKKAQAKLMLEQAKDVCITIQFVANVSFCLPPLKLSPTVSLCLTPPHRSTSS